MHEVLFVLNFLFLQNTHFNLLCLELIKWWINMFIIFWFIGVIYIQCQWDPVRADVLGIFVDNVLGLGTILLQKFKFTLKATVFSWNFLPLFSWNAPNGKIFIYMFLKSLANNLSPKTLTSCLFHSPSLCQFWNRSTPIRMHYWKKIIGNKSSASMDSPPFFYFSCCFPMPALACCLFSCHAVVKNLQRRLRLLQPVKRWPPDRGDYRHRAAWV